MDLDKSFEKMNVDEEIAQNKKQNESEKDKRNKKSKNEKYNGDDLWRMGIVCKKDCYGLSKDILSILDKNGYEWKIISSSYKIKYRKKLTENTKKFN